MTQYDPNRREQPQPLDYQNAPPRSAWQQGMRIVLWAVIIMIFSVAVLIGVVAGACVCLK